MIKFRYFTLIILKQENELKGRPQQWNFFVLTKNYANIQTNRIRKCEKSQTNANSYFKYSFANDHFP